MFNCTLRFGTRFASSTTRNNNCLRKYVQNQQSAAGVQTQSTQRNCIPIEDKRNFSSIPPKQPITDRVMSATSNVTGPTASPNAGDETSSDAAVPQHTNRLANEKSPYLLQHAHNPVDWYPWGPEAIQKAKDENKVIFLSVGYSTCHWCHVMEKESFENDDVAAVMNQHFVNIKVDREERPDIDKIYMQFLLMISNSGGWPMSVWLTPDLTPITAGTYFPPADRWGMPGFITVLRKIANQWSSNRDDLLSTGHKIIGIMEKSQREAASEGGVDGLNVEEKFLEAVKIYKRNVDSIWGGFGSHTKFPEVSKLNFALHAQIHKPDSGMADVTIETLKHIANGGIHDHVFGGFARYSVDRQWHVPHFEKMLYDQGQLLMAFSNAYKLTKQQIHLDVCDGIVRYLCSDLRHPNGGFFSGEDADSYPKFGDKEKIEGAFYAWSYNEVATLFNASLPQFAPDTDCPFDIYCYYYGITETGNVEPSSDPHGHLLAQNILRVRTTVHATAKQFSTNIETVKKILHIGNDILHTERSKRPRPHLDTKIVTAWNGLVLSGLSKLSCIKDAPNRKEYLKVAEELVKFLKANAYNEQEKTLIRTCYGVGTESDVTSKLSEPVEGFLDDYAFLINGLIDYYVATLDLNALRWAKDLQDTQDRLFWDNDKGGYFYSQENAPNVILRLKDDHDGAEPCGNSVAARNLQILSSYFEHLPYIERVVKLFEVFAGANPFSFALPEMFSALLLYDTYLTMLVVVGPNDANTQELIDVAREFYIPGLLLIHVDPAQDADTLTRKSAASFKLVQNKPTAYLCHNKVCQLPVTSADQLRTSLSEKYLLQ